MTHHEWEHVQEASRTVRSHWSGKPRVGMVLGTGLGALAREIEAEATIPYPEIPYFPRSTVESHKGQLVCGRLAGQSVMAMEGRFHLYEGYSPWQVTFPIRVMKELGCQLLIVSNAAGGLNPLYEKGDLIVIEDHINLMGLNPLIGPNDDRLGPRFPDMIEPYDRGLQNLALEVALRSEHRRPSRCLCGGGRAQPGDPRRVSLPPGHRRRRGGNVDRARGPGRGPRRLKVLGFSIVTDMCLPDALQPVRIEEIIAVANEAEAKLRTIVRGVLERWNG